MAQVFLTYNKYHVKFYDQHCSSRGSGSSTALLVATGITIITLAGGLETPSLHQ